MDEIVTGDFAKFGSRERRMAEELLKALREQGSPEDFCDDGITIVMNTRSGYVFLTNTNYQAALLNGDKLESFYSCLECGNEGFAEEIGYDPDAGLCKNCGEGEENDK